MVLNSAKPKRIVLAQLEIVLLLEQSTYKTHNIVSDVQILIVVNTDKVSVRLCL